MRLLSGAIGPGPDPVGRSMDPSPDMYPLLEGAAVLSHCGPDVHVFVRGEQRKYPMPASGTDSYFSQNSC